MIFNRQRARKYSMIMVVAGFAMGVGILPCLCSVASAETAAKPPAETAAAVPGKIPFPRPDSHRGSWLEYHGASADLNLSAGEKTCLTCHGRNDCISCHNTRPPRDHTNTWRNLSHGFMTEGNRARCVTCHRQDFCIRCHNETPPRSHTAGWLSPGRHSMGRPCTDCHGSGRLPADSCGVCHTKPLQ